jgi:hypothetical protein
MCNRQQLLKLLSCALVFAAACAATPVAVNFDSALLEFSGVEPLPVHLTGFPNNLRLRFHVPSAASILSINSLSISVDLYDDDDPNGNEEADLVFVLQANPLPNFVFGSFGTGLNGYTFAAPYTASGSLNAGDLGLALTEIQDDGFFLVRVNRNGGDFFVKNATATLDAQLVPEAATGGLAAAAVALLALPYIRRSLWRGHSCLPRADSSVRRF